MKKTALTQLIDRLEDTLIDAKMVAEKPNGFDYRDVQECHKQIRYVEMCIQEAKELLETEREQIEEAHYEGGYYTNGSVHEAKQYYKNTYK